MMARSNQHQRSVLYLLSGIFAWVMALFPASLQSQNLFVSDVGLRNIYEFSPSGVRTSFAAGINAFGIAFDQTGNLFAASETVSENNVFSGELKKCTPLGSQVTFASLLNEPRGLAIDRAGNVFVSDPGDNSIYRFTPDGSRSTFASGLGVPWGLAFDNAGNLFVSDLYHDNICKFAPDGTKSLFATLPGGIAAWGLAFDRSDNLFVVTGGSGYLYKFTPNGERSTLGTGLADPLSLAINASDHLFVGDYTGTISEFAPDGTRSVFASGLSVPYFMTFEPVPEPSAFGLLIVSIAMLRAGFAMRRYFSGGFIFSLNKVC